jgi:hypothetical protein
MYMYITRLASNEIFSPSNKIHREIGRAKDLSAHLHFDPSVCFFNDAHNQAHAVLISVLCSVDCFL